ncbi:MAG: SDR family oxidoreductase [bacterium]
MIETILITGGTGKVGKQLIKHFSQKDFNLLFTGMYQEEINNLLNTIKSDNLKGLSIDLMEEKSFEKIISFINENKLYPTTLINCARSLNFLKVDKDGITQRKEWLSEFTLDVVVPYEISMALANQKSSKLKNIINISSIYGIVSANPNLYKNPKTDSPIQYGVAKASLIHLTKELAVRLAEQNIKVNSISYGGIEGRVDDEFKTKYAKLCPLKRMLTEEEVVGAVDFLVSNYSSYITGHNMVVDGGWSVW